MQTTVTLNIDQELLQRAEAWANRHQISLSEAIANLLQQLPDPNPLPALEPWTQSLVGVIPDASLATQDEYVDYLEEKYT